MVMKVGQVNQVNFRSNEKVAKNHSAPVTYPEINQLSSVTPDFTVKTPQTYKKLGVDILDNGLEVHSYKLANGHRVTIVPMDGSPAVVKNYVNVGSMNETANIKGISHFLEHMAFNGTNGENGHIKLEVGDAFKKIDEIGGWANASTNYAITDYVNSAPILKDGDLERQIQVIGAMTEDLKLSDEMIEKEKGPVCSEINMILDDPQTIALDQTVRTLFDIKNPADELVGGSVKHIKNLTRKDVVDYYNKYYTPDNMNLVITGDVKPDEVMQLVSKNFNSRKIPQGKKFEEKLNPIQKSVRKDFVNDKTTSTHIVLGFAGPKNNDIKEKIAFDIAKIYLHSHSTNLEKNLKKYNTYPYIDSEKIGTNPEANRLIYLAATTSDKNTEKVLQGIYDAIASAPNPSEDRINEIKESILKSREENLEYSSYVNDGIGGSVLNNIPEHFIHFEKYINEITPDDVQNALKKYFNLNKAAITVIHPQQSNISFQGKSRRPIDVEKISEYKLKNNFNVGFCDTKTSNINYNIRLTSDAPYNKKAGVVEVLDLMCSMGTAGMSEDEFVKFKEKNNIDLSLSVNSNSIRLYSNSAFSKRKMIYEIGKELLYNPRLTEENLEIAKDKIKEILSRKQDTAYDLYYTEECKNSPYDFTDEEILNSLDSITLADVKECYNYLLKNSRGTVSANLPEEGKEEVKKEILNATSKLQSVQPNQIKTLEIYSENPAPKVITKANNNSQADIMQVYKFKRDNTIKENVTAKLMRSILSNSSIGLFDVLREKEHLAYSVFADLELFENQGEISCNILTTTDNKDIGEYSYENVQKSISGFTRQINELKAGRFTDKDLENAKQAMKADLLYNEGCDVKLGNITTGLNSQHEITYLNKAYKEIDSITKEDIVKMAQKAFANPPTYSIVASQDTLDFNKEYLDGLNLG